MFLQGTLVKELRPSIFNWSGRPCARGVVVPRKYTSDCECVTLRYMFAKYFQKVRSAKTSFRRVSFFTKWFFWRHLTNSCNFTACPWKSLKQIHRHWQIFDFSVVYGDIKWQQTTLCRTPSVPNKITYVCAKLDVSRHVYVYIDQLFTSGSLSFLNRGSTTYFN